MRHPWLMLALLLAAPAWAQGPSPTPTPTPRVYIPQVREIPVPSPATLPPPTLELPPEALKPLTANEAARIALAYSSDIIVARANVDAAEGRAQQAWSNLNPHLRFNASYSQALLNTGGSGVAAGGGGAATGATGGGATSANASQQSQTAGLGGAVGFTSSNYSVGGSLNQLLFDFGHTRAQVNQAEQLTEVAAANLTTAQADLVLQTKRAFYLLVQNQRLVGVQESNLTNQQAHLAEAKGRFGTGLGLPADVTRAETAVSQAISTLTQARNDAQLARVALALLMGIDPRTPLSVSDSGESAIEVPEVEGLFNMALERRPELAAGLAAIRAGEFGVRAAETTSAPSLGASLAYNRRGLSSFEFDTLFLTLSIAFEAYDGGLTAGRVREAEAQLIAQKAQLDGTRRRVLSDVATAYLDLKTAEQRLEAAEAGEINARETVRLSEGRYKAGLGIFLDVLDAQAQLLQAETNRVNAVAARSVARAALARAVGVALEMVDANKN